MPDARRIQSLPILTALRQPAKCRAAVLVCHVLDAVLAGNPGTTVAARPASIRKTGLGECNGGKKGCTMTFENQIAVITGASSGIGWALALELASQGARVGLIARRLDKLDELAAAVRERGGLAAVAVADVAERDQIHHAIAEMQQQLGPIDLMIANAGVGAPTHLHPLNIEQVERMFRVNLMGVVYTIEAALPQMLQRRTGHVAAVSSLAAYKGLPGESAYCASKAAVNVYLEGLRIQLRSHNIKVTAICPGFVKTPMTDPFEFKMPFAMDAPAAARRIVRALGRGRKIYNFPLPMHWMMKATAWLPDWAMALGMKSYTENPPDASAM
jgi:short-subunit dehydrogenase